MFTTLARSFIIPHIAICLFCFVYTGCMYVLSTVQAVTRCGCVSQECSLASTLTCLPRMKNTTKDIPTQSSELHVLAVYFCTQAMIYLSSYVRKCYVYHGCFHRYLKQRKETDPIFVSFTQQRRGAELHTLESLLQLPISRIWEYDKLIVQLMAVTPEFHPDYPNLKEASLKLHAVSLWQYG